METITFSLSLNTKTEFFQCLLVIPQGMLGTL